MAYNTSFTAEAVQLQRHSHGFMNTVAESPIIGGRPADGDGGTNLPKRPRTHSPPLFGSPDSTPNPHSLGLSLGLETKKLIVSTCRAIVKLELTLSNLDAKSSALEQHRSNGTFPKDLSLPKKKSLFEDEQSKVDEILNKASMALLMQRLAEISRKISEIQVRKQSLESDLMKTLESARDSQLQQIPSEDIGRISIVKQRFALNVSSYHSQLAISRENAFLKQKRAAEKEAKKRLADAAMDTTPEARVIDVLDQRLKQLGLIGKKSRSSSPKSGTSRSRSSSLGSAINSCSASSRSPSHISSRSSSRGSRVTSRRHKKQGSKKQGSKKSVTFDTRQPRQPRQSRPKNGRPTTSLVQRGKRGQGRGNH